MSIPESSLAETKMALQEVRDLPAALLNIAYDGASVITEKRSTIKRKEINPLLRRCNSNSPAKHIMGRKSSISYRIRIIAGGVGKIK